MNHQPTPNFTYKAYVAGKWNEPEVVRQVQQAFRDRGYTITHDWTSLEGTQDKHLMSKEELAKFRAKCAELDINGVKEADVVFVIMTDKDYAYRGTFTEIGCALGLEKIVILVCPSDDYQCATNCFFHHPDILRVKTVEEGLAIWWRPESKTSAPIQSPVPYQTPRPQPQKQKAA